MKEQTITYNATEMLESKTYIQVYNEPLGTLESKWLYRNPHVGRLFSYTALHVYVHFTVPAYHD
jgi:hypothetical protein